MESFFTVLAWIFGWLSLAVLAIRMIAFGSYSERDRMMDEIRGIERIFPVWWPGVVFIICLAWLIK